jgi:hypothetical protein
MDWSEDPDLTGTKTVAVAKPSDISEYRINKESDTAYWAVALVKAAGREGTINFHIGEAASQEDAEKLAEDDFALGLENERARVK